MGYQRNSLIFLIISCFLVNFNLAQQRYKAFAAPTGPNAIEIEGSNKPFFKTAPTKDGVIHAIADEVQPGVVLQFQPEAINDFPAYDDNLVQPNQENEVYIPPFFRNETEKEKEAKTTTTTTRKPPRVQTQRSTLPPSVFIPTRALPSSVPRRPQQPVQQQTLPPIRQPKPRPTVQPPRPLPPVQQQTFAPIRQPQPRPTVQPAQQQPQQQFIPRLVPAPPPAQQRPVQQPLPQRPQQQQPFQTRPPPPPPAQAPQQQLRPVPPPQQTQSPPPPQFRPQPQFGRQPPTHSNSIRPTVFPRPLRPFQQNRQRPPTPGNAPRISSNGRSATCPFTIFYQSNPATSFEAEQTFTHFAAVVSVDQCARTCHEFRCTFAFFDPINRHCQFNPGNGFREITCPNYPNPLLRNNVPLSAVPLRLSCIVCQRRKRTNRNRGQFFTNNFGQNRRQFRPQVIGRSVANVLHGVVLRQPQSVAIGFNDPIFRNETIKDQQDSSIETDIISGEQSSQKENIIPAGWISLNMHKLSSAEASEESKERLSKFSSKEFIDNSTEKDEKDVRISENQELIKKIPQKNIEKTQRITATEKFLEANEFA